jgi:hypothetical protein
MQLFALHSSLYIDMLPVRTGPQSADATHYHLAELLIACRFQPPRSCSTCTRYYPYLCQGKICGSINKYEHQNGLNFGVVAQACSRNHQQDFDDNNLEHGAAIGRGQPATIERILIDSTNRLQETVHRIVTAQMSIEKSTII